MIKTGNVKSKLRLACVSFNIENMVSDMAIFLKLNILHGRLSEANKDIQIEFDFALHLGPTYCNDTIYVPCIDEQNC